MPPRHPGGLSGAFREPRTCLWHLCARKADEGPNRTGIRSQTSSRGSFSSIRVAASRICPKLSSSLSEIDGLTDPSLRLCCRERPTTDSDVSRQPLYSSRCLATKKCHVEIAWGIAGCKGRLPSVGGAIGMTEGKVLSLSADPAECAETNGNFQIAESLSDCQGKMHEIHCTMQAASASAQNNHHLNQHNRH